MFIFSKRGSIGGIWVREEVTFRDKFTRNNLVVAVPQPPRLWIPTANPGPCPCLQSSSIVSFPMKVAFFRIRWPKCSFVSKIVPPMNIQVDFLKIDWFALQPKQLPESFPTPHSASLVVSSHLHTWPQESFVVPVAIQYVPVNMWL